MTRGVWVRVGWVMAMAVVDAICHEAAGHRSIVSKKGGRRWGQGWGQGGAGDEEGAEGITCRLPAILRG